MTVMNFEPMDAFVTRWQNAGGKERANYQMFFAEFCDALGVERPNPQGAAIAYGFDHSMTIFTPSGKRTPGYIDFYKENHFVIEAKQGSSQSGKGTAKRGTQGYLKAMEGAFNQAIAYARNVEQKPPFVLTCDIGSHFELWLGFGGDYGGYGARREIPLADLKQPDVFELFVDIFTNPQARNPEKIAAIVTREVAADLADLAKSLERPSPQPSPEGRGSKSPAPLLPREKGLGDEGHNPQAVAQFLMRCIFTMFAEDVGLLKEQLFTDTLRDRWLQDPKSFKPGAEALWRAMNEGNDFGFYGKLLRFNGGLFGSATAFDLTGAQLDILLKAAKRDWRNVEPAIFGTLLERALESKERSKLGAHYTPRSYVERLVRPVVLEPLRDRWGIVQAEVSATLGDEPTKGQVTKAKGLLEGFLTELRSVKVLDPACGSGNFLYVTLDLIKQLESEVFRRLGDVTGGEQLPLDIAQVNPSQFLGIELNPRAAAIADLVIWIGYLQWHFRRFGDIPPIEPVLREYANIENRDAVLAWDRVEPDVDKDGKVRTRWGGRVMKSAVTGEDVPDATDQVTILKYINPRQAVWPEADYIVSNPPFIGNARMREMLGDGYSETLRKAYQDVPDTVDFVMYWWHKAAELVTSEKINRFGFITTNSIRQPRLRSVIESYLSASVPLHLIFAIPDHPWSDDGADVRISMTAAERNNFNSSSMIRFGDVISEKRIDFSEEESESIIIKWKNSEIIFSNLQTGSNLSMSNNLNSNAGLACQGVKLHGKGFLMKNSEVEKIEDKILRPFMTGRGLLSNSIGEHVIDLFGIECKKLELEYPKAYQWLLENVKNERDQNNRKIYREKWWLFGEPRASYRHIWNSKHQYIATTRTAKYRVFQFLSSDIVSESGIVMIFLDDSYCLGVLSSQIHVIWSMASGGWMGVGNDSVYNHARCFGSFPFPDPTEPQKQKIRDLGDRLDAHRKRVQAAHPEVTITAMYNLLEKLRKAAPLDDKDRAFNQKALVSTLKQIHDELDAAVFEAYGWEDLIGGARGLLPSPQPSPEGRGSMKNAATSTPVPVPLLPGEKGLGDEGQSSLTGKERRIPEPLLQRARQLRQTQTPAEKILWECLRDRGLYEAKFRRQHNIGQFIADFYCHTAKLVIELDGSIHDTQIERDQDRDEWMQANGINVLRFKNEQILDELEAALTTIAQHLLPSPQPSPDGRRSMKNAITPDLAPLLPGEKGLGDEGQPQSVDEQILDRLVKLNAQRAEEERNGHIRWLRPEYQAPDEVQSTQGELAGITTAETIIPTPATQQPWPKDFKDQLAAIRDLLRTQGGEWSLDAIAAQFKNATRSKAKIKDCLDALETLGLVAQHTENSKVTWYFAELQKAR